MTTARSTARKLIASRLAASRPYVANLRQEKTDAPTILHAPSFRGANLEIQSYAGAEWMLSGPAETGKTWATLWRLDSLLRSTPRVKATLARKVQADIYGTVLVTWEAIQEMRAAMGQPRAIAYGGEKPQWYNYVNGSRLWVGGLDKPGKILSAERDLIYINQAEQITKDDWEYCLTRATGRGAVLSQTMLFGDCNPGPEDHWIIKRQTLKVFHSKHVDNPSLYTDAGEQTAQGVKSITRLQSLTGINKKRLYFGLWVGAEGLFFEEFDPEDGRVVIDPFPIPADWPVWLALDYGFGHPTAIGLFTRDSEGVVYLIAEHVQHKWLPPLHCRAIRRQAALLKALDRRGKPIDGLPWDRVQGFYAGHDVFYQRGATDGRTIADQYRDSMDPETGEPNGFNLEHADVARVAGAAELLTRFGNKEMGIDPTIKIFSTCRRTISCLTRMVTDPKDAQDVLKVDVDVNGEGGDDPYDMLRYGVMTQYHEPQQPAQSYSSSRFQ